MDSFQCPKCGAPVSYQRDVIGANLTAKCSYCNSTLSVPHGNHPAVVIDLRNTVPAASNALKWIVLIVLIPIIGIVVAVVAMGGFLVPLLRSNTTPPTPPVSAPNSRPVSAPAKETASGFANLALQFGEDGIGPGMFKDIRSIGVDGSGKIYVGEYTGGRVQVFDADGKFLTQWTVDPKMPLRGLTADRLGTVYVAQSGKILRYRGETGEQIGQIDFPDGNGFDDVVTTPDGGLITAWSRNRDDIVRFNSSGQVTKHIRAAISSASGDSELNTRVAIDGLGNIYALGTFNDAVFKFSSDGKFQNRFGDDGDQPGQFRAPYAIAVDGKGRVYVGDFKGVQVFDTNGRYLDVFKPQGPAFGMVFNDKGELFVAARNKVLKYSIAR